MKRAISVIILSVILTFSVAVSVSAEQVTSTGTGFTNIGFSNGYKGFCIDRYLSGSYSGDSFTTAKNTSVADNNSDKSDISQKLKLLFTQCFEDFFIPDGNGGYVIDSDKADSGVAYAIYHFTGEQNYIWGDGKDYVNKVNAYEGPEIPDEGYVLKLDNGDVVTFYFTVMEPQKDGQQSFFAYKLNVSQDATHEHDYSDDWKSDEDNHWHECECESKKDVAPHKGTTADCKNPSVCEDCGKELAPADSKNHTGETVIKNAKPATEFENGYTGDVYCKECGALVESGREIPATHEHDYSDDWKSDEDNHWHECECEGKKDVAPHKGTTADCKNPSVCEDCGKELAPADSKNHTGETVIKNDKPATEFENGYTGDVYCKECGALVESGREIPATHEHDYSDDWKSDEDNHWHECECEGKTDVEKHTFSNGVCSVCGKAAPSTDEEPDADSDFEFIFNSLVNMLPEMEEIEKVIESVTDMLPNMEEFDKVIDSIKDKLPDMGSVDFGNILGKLPGFGSDNNKGDGEDSSTDSDTDNDVDMDKDADIDSDSSVEIPDTGRESHAAFACVVLFASFALFAVLIRKRKTCVD